MTESQPEKKIIVIPAKKESPQEQAKKRNLRVAAYCRVSTVILYKERSARYSPIVWKRYCPFRAFTVLPTC